MSDVLERFWAKVDTSGECWLWTGAVGRSGYGHFRVGSKTMLAHRFGWELFTGHPIKDGMVYDHLCRTPLCVNPAHGEIVTSRENNLRGINPRYITFITGVCQKGHSMDDARLRANGTRNCRSCSIERDRKRYVNAKG